MIDERYPAAFLDECREILKDEFPAFLRALALPPRRALRLNPQRNGAEQAAAPFLPDGAPRVPWEPLGRYLAADAKPGAGIAHAAGAFYLQDASAMAPVATLDPRPGERVLDLCAAPGGKSGQIAARLNGRGFLLSNEIEFSRARILLGNLERLGVTNAFVTSAPAEALARALPAFFDRVLVDAPCSGEGMFRRDPEAASQWNPDAPAGCATRQTAILNDAARMVRPGGKLVYSTCTFNRLENEGTVREFLRAHPDFEPDAFELPGVGASRDGCLRLWPHRIEGEGHFLARFTRKEEETCARNVSLPEVRASVESRRVESETFSVRAQINDGAPSEARATAKSGRVESETFPVRAQVNDDPPSEARASAESGRVESETFPVRAPSEARASAESRHVESETFSVRAQINDGAPSEARTTAESGRIESGTFPVRTLPEARASAESGRVESETSSVRAQINDGAPSEARATAKSGRVESETFSVRAPSEARATAESGRVESETFSVRALPEVRATAESGRIESETFPVRTLPEARASAESGRVESETSSVRAQINDGAPSEARAAAESGRIESETFPVRAQINDGAPSEARASAESGRIESETFSVRALPEVRTTAENGRIESETFPVRVQVNDGAPSEACATAESGRIESETFPVRASKGSGRFESPNARPRTDNSRRASAPKGRAAASRDSCGRGTPKPDLSEFVRALPEGEIVVDGDEVRLVSALAPDPAKLTGVRVLRAGLPLATLGRSHIEPAHALAMALDPETTRQTIDLTDEQAASYLSGEAFPVDAPSGWTLAAWRSLPLGWCKITGGTLKNHLPKGLRRRG